LRFPSLGQLGEDLVCVLDEVYFPKFINFIEYLGWCPHMYRFWRRCWR